MARPTYTVTRRDATDGRQHPAGGGEVVYAVTVGGTDPGPPPPPSGTHTADRTDWTADGTTPTADAL